MVGIIVGSVIGVLLLILFVVLYSIYRFMYFSPKKGQNNELRIEPSMDYQGIIDDLLVAIKEIQQIPYEDLWIKSRDGLNLHGYFYKNEKSNKFVLMFNGYRGTPRSNFCGSAIDAMNMGYNVILCDQRAHGMSEGHSITFGRKEQHDVVTWINFVKEKWGKSIKIVIAGISMGAATVLMASDKIDPEIKVIADCPYSSTKMELMYMMKQMKFPPKLTWPFAHLASIVFCHARLKDDALVNVRKSKSQILIIHGTADTVVPYKMSERVYLANKDHVQYELFEGVEHAISYFKDNERYKKIIKNFIED